MKFSCKYPILKAIIAAIEGCNLNLSEVAVIDVLHWMEDGTLTVCKDYLDRKYMWLCINNESCCVAIDTLDSLSETEITAFLD